MSDNEVRISKIIGNIKREFSTEDFNPYLAMEEVFSTCLAGGQGSQVVMIGHTQRFVKSLVPATWHVMRGRGLIKRADDVQLPAPVLNTINTYSGAKIKYVKLVDSDEGQATLVKLINESQIICMCSKYKSAALNQVLRANLNVKKILDLSRNNEPAPQKEVEKQD